MYYIGFYVGKRLGYGILEKEQVWDFSQVPGAPQDLLALIIDGNVDVKALQAAAPVLNKSEIRLTSPITTPLRNVICLGKNYEAHVNEVKNLANDNHQLPAYPIYFTKMVDRFTGPDESLEISHGVSQEVDYEAELAFILGKTGKNIAKEDAFDYIFGYTVGNDFSARELQRNHNQWFHGKSLDGFCGLGPVVLPKEAVAVPPILTVQSYVNGELRQNGDTSMFIFDIPTILADLSRGTTLKAGDIILTGTPAGVGAGFNPPRYLKPGDEVKAVIEQIGTLTTHLI